MGELTRFRLLRNPADDCGAFPRVMVPAPHRTSSFLQDLMDVAGPGADRGESYADQLAAVAATARSEGGFDPGGDTTTRAADVIAALTAWLACHPSADPHRMVKWLIRLLKDWDFGTIPAHDVFDAVVNVGDWQSLLALFEDRLLLTLVEASAGALADGTAVVWSPLTPPRPLGKR